MFLKEQSPTCWRHMGQTSAQDGWRRQKYLVVAVAEELWAFIGNIMSNGTPARHPSRVSRTAHQKSLPRTDFGKKTYTELFKQIHFDRALCISNDPMERFTVEELLSNNQGYNRLSRWLLDDCIISELIPGGHRAVAAAWENTKWNETENKKKQPTSHPGVNQF